MLSKEEVVQRFWLAEMQERNRKRMQKQIDAIEYKKLNRAEYFVGVMNEDGQYEVVQAKPVSNVIKLIPEVSGVLLIWFSLFAYLENTIGVMV
jgi:hypothetical protein